MNKSILFIHPRDNYTGSTKVLADLILLYNDYNVSVITIEKENGFLSEIDNLKIIHLPYLQYKGRDIKFLSGFSIAICNFILTLYYGRHFSYIYLNTILTGFSALAARILRKKIIYHIHEKIYKRTFGVKINEYIFNHTKAKRIYVSEYLKNAYVNDNSDTVVKYNSLNNHFLENVRLRPPEIRQCNSIIFISSLAKIKGVFIFINLATKLPQYHFIMILSATELEIKRKIKNGIPSNLIIIPKQSNIHPFLHNADLILNLSIPPICVESFGLTILEAMAYGIPAIVPNIGGPTELVIDNFNGYCINPNEIDLIVEKVRFLLNNKELYISFCHNALERAAFFNINDQRIL